MTKAAETPKQSGITGINQVDNSKTQHGLELQIAFKDKESFEDFLRSLDGWNFSIEVNTDSLTIVFLNNPRDNSQQTSVFVSDDNTLAIQLHTEAPAPLLSLLEACAEADIPVRVAGSSLVFDGIKYNPKLDSPLLERNSQNLDLHTHTSSSSSDDNKVTPSSNHTVGDASDNEIITPPDSSKRRRLHLRHKRSRLHLIGWLGSLAGFGTSLGSGVAAGLYFPGMLQAINTNGLNLASAGITSLFAGLCLAAVIGLVVGAFSAASLDQNRPITHILKRPRYQKIPHHHDAGKGVAP